MRSEDYRARLAARRFRQRVLGSSAESAVAADMLLSAAESYTGYQTVLLPPDDPLLAGASATLDRDFQTIWTRDDLHHTMQYADRAHEFGHLVLHAPPDQWAELPDSQAVDGYSKDQRDERDAHRFAAEFLLPLPLARSLFLDGRSATQIAKEFQLPKMLVVRQLIEAFSDTEQSDMADAVQPPKLDGWQTDGLISLCPAVIIGASGTGKTTTLLGRCKHLIELGVDSRNIHIFVANEANAEEMRRSLLLSAPDKLTLISASTPGQFAYDVAVRFPDEADPHEGQTKTLGAVRETLSASRFEDTALRILDRRGEVADILRARFEHVLVDVIDLMSASAAELIVRSSPKSGDTLWITASPPWSPEASAGLERAHVHPLPRQYRAASQIQEFMNATVPPDEKRTLIGRPYDDRCGCGTVTLALAATHEQMVLGIQTYLQELFAAGYSPDDVAIRCRGAEELETISSLRSVDLFQATLAKQKVDNCVDDLLSFVGLRLNQWNAASILRVGRLPEYDIPLDSLLQLLRHLHDVTAFEERVRQLRKVIGTASSDLLAEHLTRCRRGPSLRHLVYHYVFDLSDYLRLTPAGGAAVRDLHLLLAEDVSENVSESFRLLFDNYRKSHSLPVQSAGSGIHLFKPSRSSRATFPVVIEVGFQLQALSDRLFLKAGDSSPRGSFDAASCATDHLLYCVVTSTPRRLLPLAERIARKVPGVTVLDWLSLTAPPPFQQARSITLTGDSDDERLKQQCPRRYYYRRLLQLAPGAVFTIRSGDYPASPSDAAFCTTCDYRDLCPAAIN